MIVKKRFQNGVIVLMISALGLLSGCGATTKAKTEDTTMINRQMAEQAAQNAEQAADKAEKAAERAEQAADRAASMAEKSEQIFNKKMKK